MRRWWSGALLADFDYFRSRLHRFELSLLLLSTEVKSFDFQRCFYRFPLVRAASLRCHECLQLGSLFL